MQRRTTFIRTVRRERDGVTDSCLVLRGERSVQASTPAFDLFLGTEATPAVLAGDLRRHSILHFACHGLVDVSDSRRSGLALSGTPERSGFLTMAEVLSLDLDADLVVLSACETAQGQTLRGEGVQSMARAFLFAGARGVIASLWMVDDAATQQLMSLFYASLQSSGSTLDPVTALREARLQMRNWSGDVAPSRGFVQVDRREPAKTQMLPGHPYTWAAFVPVGGF